GEHPDVEMLRHLAALFSGNDLAQVLDDGGGLKPGVTLQVYRPEVDDTGSVFLKFSAVPEGPELQARSSRWVALTLSGDRWVFDHSGLPIRQADRFGNSVQF